MRTYDGLDEARALKIVSLDTPLVEKRDVLRSCLDDQEMRRGACGLLQSPDFPQQIIPPFITARKVDLDGIARSWVYVGCFAVITWDQTDALIAFEGVWLCDVHMVPWDLFRGHPDMDEPYNPEFRRHLANKVRRRLGFPENGRTEL